jgi:S1-C subfamily serine protease
MKKVLKIMGIGLLIFVIGGLGGVFLNYMLLSKVVANPDLSQNPIVQALDQRVQIIKSTEKIVVADNESIADIASRASTSVAYIESIDANGIHNSGNGVVMSSDGIIATTLAVVPKDATTQYIKLSDGIVYDVIEKYIDDYTGIVFLRIDANDLATISFANSDEARSGKRLIIISRLREADEPQFAVGGFLGRDYIFNISSPVSDFLQGVLSVDFSQIAVSQSVGAPAVDFHGNMLGLISYKETPELTQKEYYAIAASDVNQAFEEFLHKNNPDVESVKNDILLGINYQLNTALDVHIDDTNITTGVIVESPQTYAQQQIFANSLAAKSGINGGDIIVTVNNETIDVQNNLSKLMHKYSKMEQKIVLQILRGEKTITIDIIQNNNIDSSLK